MKRTGIWIGTSGWSYKEWAGHFYPKAWPKKNEFLFYARHFPTVEINATFYRLPTLKTVRGWRDRAPRDFVFAVKGSRYLTHIRRLKDTGPGLRKYFSRLKPLAGHSGPILWQLPPTFKKTGANWQRLERFLAKLPPAFPHAVEFRHPSWLDEQTLTLLRQHRVANVWISSMQMPVDHTVTADFVFLRFHGLAGGAYHDYTEDELAPWAEQLVEFARQGLPAFVYFNNDLNIRAPLNAKALMTLVGAHAVPSLDPESALPLKIAPPVKGPATWRPWTRNSKATKTRKPASATTSGPARRKRTMSAGDRQFAGAAFSASAPQRAR
ncbi:MAG: DUF72 domain-containing protein [Opitutaceae bacterium]